MIEDSKKSLPMMVEQSIIDGFLAMQPTKEFERTLDGNLESVDYLPDSTVRFWYNNSGEDYEAHWHLAYELIAPLEGKTTVLMGQQAHELNPGDIFIIPGGVLHGLRMPPRGARFVFLFELDMLTRIEGSAYLMSCLSEPVLINRNVCPSIYDAQAELVVALAREYLAKDSLREVAIYAKLFSFFLNYGRYALSLEGHAVQSQLTQANQKNYAQKFNAVFAYLDQHYAEDLTLEKVADVAGFSKFHFSRIFKQFSGFNFCDYLRRRRIKSAEVLLMKPGLSISEIALQSGFSSVSTFNRTFKQAKGCTPTEYRGMFEDSMG